jgi:hypothetical protein
MVAELHARDGAAGLCAVEARRCKKTVRVGERATIGKAAAFGGGNGGGSSSPRLVLHEPVARHVGARDRRDQQLRIGVLRRRNDPLDRTGLGDMRAVDVLPHRRMFPRRSSVASPSVLPLPQLILRPSPQLPF